jgi:hypothetical protein
MRHSPTRRLVLAGLAASACVAMPASLLGQTASPAIAVSKDPSCGCCNGWIAHLRQAGFTVTAQDTRELPAIKKRLGVPDRLSSCHTAEIGGYVIEGHVPADAIRRLLKDAPRAAGLAVPGMPVGSPGMEGGMPEIYEVVLFGADGERVFARYRGVTAL